MLDLALNYGRGQVRLREVAERQEVSEKYLEHLASSLKAAGLVRGLRGRHGGYTLSHPPAEIRLSQIHAALEGSLAPAECVDDPAVCSREKQCVMRDVWTEMRDAVKQVLDATTLQDLVDRQHEKVKSEAEQTYCI
jgi:Rrf2 family protein